MEQHYVGLDVHCKESVFVIQDGDGTVVAQGAVPTNPTGLQQLRKAQSSKASRRSLFCVGRRALSRTSWASTTSGARPSAVSWRATKNATVPLSSATGVPAGSAVIAVLSDVRRFPDAKHAASYAGLVPTTYQSGDRAAYGHITKRGSGELRAMLCKAAHHASRPIRSTRTSPSCARGAGTRWQPLPSATGSPGFCLRC